MNPLGSIVGPRPAAVSKAFSLVLLSNPRSRILIGVQQQQDRYLVGSATINCKQAILATLLLATFRLGESTVKPFLNWLHCIAYRVNISTGGAIDRGLLHTSDSCTMVQEMRSCSSHAATMDVCHSRSNLNLSAEPKPSVDVPIFDDPC